MASERAAYFRRRLRQALFSFLAITLLVFALMRLAPGDPAELRYSSQEISAEDLSLAREQFRSEHLLDRSWLRQYLHFLGPFDLSSRGASWFGGSGEDWFHGLLVLDFGHEFQRPAVLVRDELLARAAVSVPLGCAALVLALSVAIPLGIWSARRRNTLLERGSAVLLFALDALPLFWIALGLVLCLGASGLGWFPILGLSDPDAEHWSPAARFFDRLHHACLPVLSLSLGMLAYLARQTRSSVLESLRMEFVRTAQAKGLSERRVLYQHVLRHAALPLIAIVAMLLPGLIAGSVVVESVFAIPGLGRYAFEAVLARDYAVIGALTALGAILTLAALITADLVSARLDPRIRHD